MKYLFRFLSFGCFLLSCQSREEQVIASLGSKQLFRKVNSEIYASGSGFCSESLFLNSDSTFFHEAGCEGRSRISVGSWRLTGDSIEFFGVGKSQLCLVANVEFSKKHNSRRTILVFIDKTGRPVQHFPVLPVKQNDKFRVTSNSRIVVDENGDEIYCSETNASGAVSFDKSKFDTIIFRQLEVIANRPFRIPTTSLSDTVRIFLDLVGDFSYGELTYEERMVPLKLKVQRNKLVNPEHELILLK